MKDEWRQLELGPGTTLWISPLFPSGIPRPTALLNLLRAEHFNSHLSLAQVHCISESDTPWVNRENSTACYDGTCSHIRSNTAFPCLSSTIFQTPKCWVGNGICIIVPGGRILSNQPLLCETTAGMHWWHITPCECNECSSWGRSMHE